MSYTEEVAYMPGSTREPAHASHRPAPRLTAGQRSADSDALASAALERARAVLASHKTSIKTPAWY
ncbi:hypothetical protein [Cupriavidus sp.]|jgi:hypothetical protein|uniref:hypothetical protein n=1 Tax=Cupriavidus sp. TaxID=1873897 RepID=UPI0028BD8F9E|nr:hypothetical protein [Cupriavidus sp.]